MKRPAAALLAALVLALAVVSAWAVRRARPRPPRLVLVYATCSLNKDHLSPYAPAVEYTPRLQAFATEAAVFLRHHTESGHSGPDFASILTGTQAGRHGVFSHPRKLAAASTTVFEAFAAAGFETHFWGGHPMASPSLDYAQGVDPARQRSRALIAHDAEFLALLDRLRSDGSARALVFTNFTVTHPPYSEKPLRRFCADFPERCARVPWADYAPARDLLHSGRLTYDFAANVERYGLTPEGIAGVAALADALYASNVRVLDALFGDVVDAVGRHGLLEESVIVFTADHGEVLFRPSAPFPWTHGYQLTAADLGVPLVVRGPGVRAGRFEGVSRSIDVAPTLAGLAGVPLPAGAMDGVDLSPTLRDGTPPPRLLAFSHTMLLHGLVAADQPGTLLGRSFAVDDPDGMWVAVRDRDWLFRFSRAPGGPFRTSAFDLARDPVEERDRFDEGDVAHRQIERELRGYKASLVEAFRRGAPGAEPPRDEQEERLRSLGYIN